MGRAFSVRGGASLASPGVCSAGLPWPNFAKRARRWWARQDSNLRPGAPRFRQRGPWYMREPSRMDRDRGLIDARRARLSTRAGMLHECTTAASVRRWMVPRRHAVAAIAARSCMVCAGVKRLRRARAAEPVMAIVSIKSPAGHLLRRRRLDPARASLDRSDRVGETPAGVFAIVQKEKDHRSNMYDDAWMPHMQRITWSGIALHGGPSAWAMRLRAVACGYLSVLRKSCSTRHGSEWGHHPPNDATPVPLPRPALLVPNAEALAAARREPRPSRVRRRRAARS